MMTESTSVRMEQPRRSAGLALLAYALALAVVIIDQASKLWVTTGLLLPDRLTIPVVPPLFSLTMVWNRGVSFGFLRDQADVARWGLVGFSAVVAAALAVWAWRVERRLAAVAIGLVMGGAVGNLIDRARLGAVIDFLDFSGLHFPWVFNGADSAISVGVALLLLDSVLQPKPDATPG